MPIPPHPLDSAIEDSERVVICAFDHYIEKDEEPPIPYDYRGNPRNSSDALRYAAAEDAFWELHLRLSVNGAWRVRGRHDLIAVNPAGRRLKELWLRSHRSMMPRARFLDLLYPRFGLRLVHHWDLTDFGVSNDPAALAEVRKIVAEVGLFTLPVRPGQFER